MADDKLKMRVIFMFCLSFLAVTAAKTSSLSEVICGASGFDVSNLTARTWTMKAPKAYCLTANSSTPDDGCLISMAFCRSLNMADSCADAAVCETYTSDNTTHRLATFDASNQPFNTSDPAMSTTGFHTGYLPGEDYTNAENKSCKLQTVMTFVCNSSAIWTRQQAQTVQPVPVSPNIQYDSLKCLYNLTFQFAGACPLIVPSSQIPVLSAGSVLLLIFFVSVIMYFVFGCFINIVRGKTGSEIVPHHMFWTMLPVYIMEGMQFTLSCGRRQASKTYESI